MSPPSNHTLRLIPGSLSSLSSQTKNVIPISLSEFLFRIRLHQIPLQIQIYFLQRVSPPNPHLLLPDGPFPSSNFMRSLFPANCPDSRGKKRLFWYTPTFGVVGVVAVPRVSQCTLVLPPTILYVILPQPQPAICCICTLSFYNTYMPTPPPFSNFKNVSCQWLTGCAACATLALMHFHLLLSSLSFILLYHPRNHSK